MGTKIVKKPAKNFRVSKSGVHYLISHEKFRSQVYLDTGGHPTIGYGHKLKPGEAFPKGVTREEAAVIFRQDLKWAESAVQRDVKVPISQPQFDALTVLTYNIGARSFYTSKLLKLLNAGDEQGAADQFLAWNKDLENGVYVAREDLTRRRREERALFLSGV